MTYFSDLFNQHSYFENLACCPTRSTIFLALVLPYFVSHAFEHKEHWTYIQSNPATYSIQQWCTSTSNLLQISALGLPCIQLVVKIAVLTFTFNVCSFVSFIHWFFGCFAIDIFCSGSLLSGWPLLQSPGPFTPICKCPVGHQQYCRCLTWDPWCLECRIPP